MRAHLSYRGPADLTLIYGEPGELGCTLERPGIEVVVSQHAATAPVSVLVNRHLGVDLLKPMLSRAAVALPDGTVLSGQVLEVSATGDYFEMAAGAQCDTGERYA
ncbi:hypothetical protein [Pseudomonas kurunegalensis]|uniref:hypothetical protein n=1 Tax=Pseudomonas kurunegalensis TaxID=485880 RepID=UPI0028947F01|nr:hypothetical protein [Pseudomonas kurunegalensis]MDT3750464.1 hypothetical protein [Pseudomonas kurunegalensis]